MEDKAASNDDPLARLPLHVAVAVTHACLRGAMVRMVGHQGDELAVLVACRDDTQAATLRAAGFFDDEYDGEPLLRWNSEGWVTDEQPPFERSAEDAVAALADAIVWDYAARQAHVDTDVGGPFPRRETASSLDELLAMAREAYVAGWDAEVPWENGRVWEPSEWDAEAMILSLCHDQIERMGWGDE